MVGKLPPSSSGRASSSLPYGAPERHSRLVRRPAFGSAAPQVQRLPALRSYLDPAFHSHIPHAAMPTTPQRAEAHPDRRSDADRAALLHGLSEPAEGGSGRSRRSGRSRSGRRARKTSPMRHRGRRSSSSARGAVIEAPTPAVTGPDLAPEQPHDSVPHDILAVLQAPRVPPSQASSSDLTLPLLEWASSHATPDIIGDPLLHGRVAKRLISLGLGTPALLGGASWDELQTS